MSKKSAFENMNDDMLSALLDWRQRHGRSWKLDLSAAWMNGADEHDPRGSSLRMIRNRLGPGWLDTLRPKYLDAETARRGLTTDKTSPEPAAIASAMPSPETR